MVQGSTSSPTGIGSRRRVDVVGINDVLYDSGCIGSGVVMQAEGVEVLWNLECPVGLCLC